MSLKNNTPNICKAAYEALFFLVVILLFAAPSGRAQTVSSKVSFANTLQAKGEVSLLHKGNPIRPYPFKAGDISARFELPPGSFQFTVDDGERPAKEMTIETIPGQGATAVVHELLEKNEETGEITKEIGVLAVPSSPPGSGSVFRVVYVGGDSPISVVANGSSLTLEPNTFSKPFAAGLNFTVHPQGIKEPWHVTLEEHGQFLIIIFLDSEGELKYTMAYG